MQDSHDETGTPSTDLPTLVITLLKGVMYREQNTSLWNSLFHLQAAVREYVSVLNLELELNDAEGYAFLRSCDESDTGLESKLPRLVTRRPLSFPVSLLLALLRKKLAEFDASGSDTRLVLSRNEIVELVQVFLPERSNEVRLINQIESHISKIVKLGFLRRLSTNQSGNQDTRTPMFEVQRIITSFVDAQWLSNFDTRLAEYQTHISNSSDGHADD